MSISIRPADQGSARKDFFKLPYLIQKDNPLWAPPLLMQQKALLDINKHPFFQNAQIKLFVACQNGVPVGRIAVINDFKHNKIHSQTTTHFGFFECINDNKIAAALFEQVEKTAKNWGHNMVRGPFNHSVNEEIGLQVNAFDTPNFVMIPGNPAYYGPLVEGAGYSQCMDLYCYKLDAGEMRKKLLDAAPKIEKRLNITIRKMQKKTLEKDALKIWEVYNKAWKNNWFWLPATKEEFLHTVADLKAIADFDLLYLAENHKGELVGFSIAVPNMNEALVKIRNGRLLPFGIFKLLWHARPGAIKSIRVLIMGVLEQYRGRGIDAVLYHHQYRAALAKGYTSGELSQVLQSNTMMNRAAELMGGKNYKTHRIYEKKI
ncbi:MAG: hypothetical protein L3J13_00955 [Devosiaceae bacterium]|nr:hypothetical protein [Devosiaceae bacterium]